MLNSIYLAKTRMNANKNFKPWLFKKVKRLKEQLRLCKEKFLILKVASGKQPIKFCDNPQATLIEALERRDFTELPESYLKIKQLILKRGEYRSDSMSFVSKQDDQMKLLKDIEFEIITL